MKKLLSNLKNLFLSKGKYMGFFRGISTPGTPANPETGASLITYDNTKSGLQGTNVQDAIDELAPPSLVANVQDLVIRVKTSSTLEFQWTPLQGIARYIVDYRSVSANVSSSAPYSTPVFVAGSSYTLSDLGAGQSYQVRVRADYGTAGLSSGTTVISNTEDIVGTPGTPANFRVTEATTTTISVAFDKGVNTAGIKLWIRDSSSGSYPATPNATPSGTAYTFVSLTADTDYTIKIVATNGFTESSSVEIPFKTPSGALGNASGLAVSSFTDTTAAISWTAAQGAATYLVDFKLTTAANYVAPVEQTGTTFTFLNLSPGSAYTFRVRSKSGTTVASGVTVAQTTLGASTGGGDVIKEVVNTTYAGTGPLLVNKPAGVSGETIYIAVAYKSGDTRTLTTPAGYSIVPGADVNSATSPGRLVVYERVLAGSDPAGTVSIAVTGGSINAAVICLRTKGSRRAAVALDGGYADVFSASSVTPVVANSPVFQFVASGQWPRTMAASSDITILSQTYEPSSGPSIALGHKVVSVSSGTSTYTPTDPDLNVATGDDFVSVSLVLDGSPVQDVLSGSYTTAASQVVNLPAANAGDTLYLGVNFHASTASARTLATPAGWTLVDFSTGLSGGAGTTTGVLYVFRQSVTSASAATTVTLTFSGTITGGTYISSRHRGTFRTSAKTAAAFTTSMSAPTVTSTADNSLLLTYVGTGHEPRTFTAPVGTTELADVQAGAGPAMALGSRVVNTGATGTTTWTPSLGDDYQAMSILLDNGSTTPPTGGGGGGGTNSNKFEVGSHQHGYGINDRYAAGSYPTSTNTMEPFNFRSLRTHDNEGLNFMPWWTGRTGGIDAVGDGLNQYDFPRLFTMTDKFIGRGHGPFLWTVFGNPAWASRRPDDASSYGNGVTSWVSNSQAYRQMVRDTLLQLRARHGANAVGWIEAGNESIGGGNSYDIGQFLNAVGYPAGAGDPQTTMLAEISRAVYQGTRDAGATYPEYLTMPVLLGAHTYTNRNDTLLRLMRAKCIDGTPLIDLGPNCAWSFHPYGFADANPFQNLTELTAQLRQWATEAGTGSWDFYNTEWGTFYPWNPDPANWWLGLSGAQQGQVLYDAIGRHKALGWRGVWTYSSDGSPAPGDVNYIGSAERVPEIRASLNKAFLDFQVS